MKPMSCEPRHGERGIALVITVLLLLLMSGIGIAALNRAGDEKVNSTASRRQAMNLAAAQAGLRMVQKQLGSGNGSSPSNQALNTATNTAQQDLFLDAFGNRTNVRTGILADSNAIPIKNVGTAQANTAGNELGISKQVGGARLIYRVDVVATDASGGSSQVQAQFSVRMDSQGY